MAKTTSGKPAAKSTTSAKAASKTAARARPAPASAPKKPRTRPAARKSGPPPGLILPTRKQGAPLKLVERRKRAPGEKSFVQRLADDPSLLRTLFEQRPTWLDDLAAVLLISIGMVSLLTLLNTAPLVPGAVPSLSDQWADLISQIFGRIGAMLLSIMLMAAGTLIVLPKVGVTIHMPWRRVLAIEIAYLALLALLHLLANDPEPRALARSGLGGGYVGWALGEIMVKLFGSGLSIMLYLMVFAFAVGAVFGIRRKQVRAGVKAFSKQLETTAEMIKQRAAAARLPRPAGRHGLLRRPAESQPALGRPVRQHTLALTADAPPVENAASPSEAPFIPAAGSILNEPLYEPQPAPPIGSEPPAVPVPPPLKKPAIQPAARRAESVPQPPQPPQPLAQPEDAPKPAPRIGPAPRPAVSAVPPAHIAPPAALEPEQDSPELPALIPMTPPAAISAAPTADIPTVEPVLPKRERRYFTVEDFKEVRRPLPRGSLPPLTLLDDIELDKPTEEEINTNARIIENTLLEFDIDVEVVDVRVGPTVTQYAVQPFREVQNNQGETVLQRVRVNKIASLAGDLALALAAKRLRIQTYVPGHSYMGIEVPNRNPSVVALRPVMESEVFYKAFIRADPDSPNQMREAPLVVPLGRDVSGEAVVVDLAAMPHLLIAGTTGSGKSVCITAFTVALIMNNLPDRLKLILLDPKMVELTRFNGLPHLLGPVETDIERIIGVLRWAAREMDRRYKLLEVEAARNIEVYNRIVSKRGTGELLPYIVILIDEIGDLMLSRPEEMERTVTRLAQMARAVGMHLVVATQRPSTDVITGLIKANFPARISFAVASGVDSRVILDSTGAETLMGRGDMLYIAPDAAVPRRVQGCFVSDHEIDAVVRYWNEWRTQRAIGLPTAESAPWDRGVTRRESLSQTDPMLEEAIDLVVRQGEASASMIQRQLNVPYPRAAALMDLLNELGILGGIKEDGRTREVTMKPGSDPYRKLLAKYRQR